MPSYFSMPHFMYGDQKLTEDVVGLEANFTKHRSIIFFEPLTGKPVKANKRVQLSTFTQKDASIELVAFLFVLFILLDAD